MMKQRALLVLCFAIGATIVSAGDCLSAAGFSGACAEYTLGGVTVRGVQSGGQTCEIAGCSLGANYKAIVGSCTCMEGNSNSGGTYYVGDVASGSCTACTSVVNGGLVGGDPHFRGFDNTLFDFVGRVNATFALLSDAQHQVNSFFDSLHSGVEHDTWMTKIGIRYRDVNFTIELDTVDKDMEIFHDPEAKHETKQRMRVSTHHAHLPLFRTTINGIVMDNAVHSGQSMASGRDDVIIYFPPADAINEGDANDGPIAVVQTADYAFTIYYETEDSLHLDINVDILSNRVMDVHGVLGQTVAWAMDNAEGGAPHTHTVEGVDADYEVDAGLLGVDFKYTRFGAEQQVVSSGRRELIAGGAFVGLSGGRVSKGPSVALPNSLLRRRLHTPQRKLSAGSTNKAGLLQM